jgi:hypothetical protein
MAEYLWPDGRLTCDMDDFGEDHHEVIFQPLSTTG